MKLYKIILCIVVVMLSASCNDSDKLESSPFDNSVYLEAATVSSASNVIFKRTVTDLSRDLVAQLAYPADQDVEVTFAVDPALVSVYNAKHDSDLKLIDAKYYEFTSTKGVIPAGKVLSPAVQILFKGLDLLEIDATYLLPVTIAQSTGGISILDGSRNIYFLVRRSSAITTAAEMGANNFMAIPTLDKKEYCDVMNGLNAVTYEAIVNINEFTKESNLSSIMGVEQHCLLRVGDTGFPRQQIQMLIGADKLPAANSVKELSPNQWYHIAMTWDIATKLACLYVNGELASSSYTGGWKTETIDLAMRGLYDKDPNKYPNMSSAYQFRIGYSYDSRRPLRGLISEVRVWSVARTAQEIWDNMYEVDVATVGNDPLNSKFKALRAYWKFDDASQGNEVADQTGNGNTAVCMDCTDESQSIPIKPGTLKWNTSIEIPQLNRK